MYNIPVQPFFILKENYNMTYIKVSKEDGEKIMQPTYKYMPVFTTIDNKMVRVVAQENGKVFYIGD